MMIKGSGCFLYLLIRTADGKVFQLEAGLMLFELHFSLSGEAFEAVCLQAAFGLAQGAA
jgi:hypothetical protein